MTKKKPKSKPKSKIPISNRIIYFIIGLAITSVLVVYSYNLDYLPPVAFLGLDVTIWFYPPFIILLGVIGSSLMTSALDGKSEIDV